MSEAPKSQPANAPEEMENEAYLSIPTSERQANFCALILAAIAMGIGSESIWIGVGTLLSLFFLGSCMSNTMVKHRYLTKPKS